jgi:circadian clock protein KaiC
MESMPTTHESHRADGGIAKTSTGIRGLDEITGGGLPSGRTSLVCGSAGCGKTLLAIEFLVRGATEHDEPGVFMSFEESAVELSQNVRSLGFDLADLLERKQLVMASRRLPVCSRLLIGSTTPA